MIHSSHKIHIYTIFQLKIIHKITQLKDFKKLIAREQLNLLIKAHDYFPLLFFSHFSANGSFLQIGQQELPSNNHLSIHFL